MRVVLDIERLVLEGLPVTAAEARRIRTAVESELSRLLGACPIAARLLGGGAMPSLTAPPQRLAPRGTPEAVGIGIAQAVHRGLSGAE
jgi:hypothetical protein